MMEEKQIMYHHKIHNNPKGITKATAPEAKKNHEHNHKNSLLYLALSPSELHYRYARYVIAIC